MNCNVLVRMKELMKTNNPLEILLEPKQILGTKIVWLNWGNCDKCSHKINKLLYLFITRNDDVTTKGKRVTLTSPILLPLDFTVDKPKYEEIFFCD